MASLRLFTAVVLLTFAATVQGQEECPRCDSSEHFICGRDPVTGEKQTFRNHCFMVTANCFKPTKYVKIAEGECPDCAVDCVANPPGPICVRSWTTGVTRIFKNACVLQEYNCEHFTDLEPVPRNYCLNCNECCDTVNKAGVCGQDPSGEYILFGNLCELMKYNCKNNKSFVKVGDILCPVKP